MGNLVWDEIYKEQGEVQSDILPTVKKSISILKEHNCKKVLDLGCGTGRHSIFLAKQGFEVYSCDISQTGIEIVIKKAETLNLSNMKFKQIDMLNIDFDDNYFDAVVCVWTMGIGKYEDVEKSVNELYRVLKHNGVAIIDFQSTEDKTYGKGIEIEKNTYVGGLDGLDNLPSHYSTKEEVVYLLKDFSFKSIEPVDYFYKNGKELDIIKAYYVEAVK